jgi:2-polyprenyl-3-methyl-5-hydroxy-6-metoxy-1,4-benzoquinol methylase
MFFYLYLLFSGLIAIILIAFIITFGVPMFTGAPFAVSSRSKIKKMIELIKIETASRKDLKVVDIGSGDGRIVAALAKEGFIASGVELNPCLVWYSRLKLKMAGLGKIALVKRANFWQEDFSQYDIVVLFGVFYIMARLEKKLQQELKPGSLVFCNHFAFPTWQPVKKDEDIYIYQIL